MCICDFNFSISNTTQLHVPEIPLHDLKSIHAAAIRHAQQFQWMVALTIGSSLIAMGLLILVIRILRCQYRVRELETDRTHDNDSGKGGV